MSPATLALSAQDIHKGFHDKASGKTVLAVQGVSLAAPTGSLTALVGPDGAGKTTLLRMVCGLLRADRGQMNVLGIDVATHPQNVQSRISYMPQRFGLYEDLSVRENLDLYADLHGVPESLRRSRYDRLLSITDLAAFTKRPAGKLSGGMKQKLGLACTLVRSPELLLLDEPTVGVDPLSRRELWDIVMQLMQGERLTVIISTAYMDEAARCDQVYVVHEGRLLAQGHPDQLKQYAADACFQVSPQGDTVRALQARLLDDARIVDAVPQGAQVRFILQPGCQLSDLAVTLRHATAHPVAPRLEDSFMVLLRAHQAFDRHAAQPNASLECQAGAANGSGEVVIEVRDLVRKFGDFTAVGCTNFSVHKGEIFGLLGPNGAGKTTTFRMLCGLLPSTSGYLRVAGVDLRHARASARRNIGYVAQKFALYSNLTVHENLRFFGGAYGLSGQRLKSRIAEVLRLFQLEALEHTPAGQLTGGIKQRLSMATALLHQPDILFLDEPTSGADPLARRSFWRRIGSLADAGTTIVVTTHFMEEAEYCDRIVIQDAGIVLALGTPAEVRLQASGNAPIEMEEAFIRIVENQRRARKKSVKSLESVA